MTHPHDFTPSRVNTDRLRWQTAPEYTRQHKRRFTLAQSAVVGVVVALLCLATGWEGLMTARTATIEGSK